MPGVGCPKVKRKNRVEAGLDTGTNWFGVPEQNVLPPNALELLAFDFMQSGRLPIRKNSTSTSQRLKQSELYRSWIFLRVQQKLLSI
jgi:hypothetical protein